MTLFVRLLVIVSLLSAAASLPAVDARTQSKGAVVVPANKDQQLGAVEDGKTFVQSVKDAADTLTDYSFHSQIVTFKSSNPVREAGQFFYKKPNLLRLEVLSGPKKGALLVQGSDGKIRGHLGGMLKMINGSVGHDSKFLISSNGFNMVECDFSSLLGTLQQQISGSVKANVTSSPVSITGKGKMYVVDINDGDSILWQRVYVDPRTKLPQEWQIYKGGKLFCTTIWSEIKVNQGLTADAFTINWRG